MTTSTTTIPDQGSAFGRRLQGAPPPPPSSAFQRTLQGIIDTATTSAPADITAPARFFDAVGGGQVTVNPDMTLSPRVTHSDIIGGALMGAITAIPRGIQGLVEFFIPVTNAGMPPPLSPAEMEEFMRTGEVDVFRENAEGELVKVDHFTRDRLKQGGGTPWWVQTVQEAEAAKERQILGLGLAASYFTGNLVSPALARFGVAPGVMDASGGVIATGLRQLVGKQLVQRTITGTAAGAAFGLTRGVADPDTSLLPAIFVDATLFGGISLLGGMWMMSAKAPILPKEIILADEEVIRAGGRGLGLMVADEVKLLNEGLNAKSLAPAVRTRTLPRNAEGVPRGIERREVSRIVDTQGRHTVTYEIDPSNINSIAAVLGSPSRWPRTGGPVGDAAGRIVNNANDRQLLAFQLSGEWSTIISEIERQTGTALSLGVKVGGKGAQAVEARAKLGLNLQSFIDRNAVHPVRGDKFTEAVDQQHIKRVGRLGKLNKAENEVLTAADIERVFGSTGSGGGVSAAVRFTKAAGVDMVGMTVKQLRDTLQRQGQLAGGSPEAVGTPTTTRTESDQAMHLIMNRIEADITTLRAVKGDVADFTPSTFITSMFVRQYEILNGAGEVIKTAGGSNLRNSLAEVIFDSPELAGQINVRPAEGFTVPRELRGTFGERIDDMMAKLTEHATFDAEDVASIMQGRPIKPRSIFTDIDPIDLMNAYGGAVGKRIAFGDFSSKANAIIAAVTKIDGVNEVTTKALSQYVGDVTGEPTMLEDAARSVTQWLTRKGGAVTRIATRSDALAGKVETAISEVLDPRNVGSLITQIESMMRLGYSLPAIYMNLTQTVVNTATKIGYGPVNKAINLFMDKSKHQEVEALLTQMRIEFQVPLSQAGDLAVSTVRKPISVFHGLYGFNKAETINRAIAGLAKYLEGLDAGVPHPERIEAAIQFVRQTNFEYSIADSPAILRGPVQGAIFQFQKFAIKELEFIKDLRGAEIARFAINVNFAGGAAALLSLPPLSIADWLSGVISDETLKDRLLEKFPKAGRGIPGAIGADMSLNLGIEAPRGVLDVTGPAVADALALVQMMRVIINKGTGVLSKDLQEALSGAFMLTPEQKARAIRQLTPVAVRRLVDAVKIASSGQIRQPGTGNLIFAPEDPDSEALMTALGYRSIDRSEERRLLNMETRMRDRMVARNAVVYQRWARAFSQDNFAQMDAIIKDALEKDLPGLTSAGFQRAAMRVSVPRSLTTAQRSPRAIRADIVQKLEPFFRGRGSN